MFEFFQAANGLDDLWFRPNVPVQGIKDCVKHSRKTGGTRGHGVASKGLCTLMEFAAIALTCPNQKKITKHSQGVLKYALSPHHAARL
jgi:hypothetical protein